MADDGFLAGSTPPPTELRSELDAIDELHRLGLAEPGDSFTVTSR